MGLTLCRGPTPPTPIRGWCGCHAHGCRASPRIRCGCALPSWSHFEPQRPPKRSRDRVGDDYARPCARMRRSDHAATRAMCLASACLTPTAGTRRDRVGDGRARKRCRANTSHRPASTACAAGPWPSNSSIRSAWRCGWRQVRQGRTVLDGRVLFRRSGRSIRSGSCIAHAATSGSRRAVPTLTETRRRRRGAIEGEAG